MTPVTWVWNLLKAENRFRYAAVIESNTKISILVSISRQYRDSSSTWDFCLLVWLCVCTWLLFLCMSVILKCFVQFSAWWLRYLECRRNPTPMTDLLQQNAATTKPLARKTPLSCCVSIPYCMVCHSRVFSQGAFVLGVCSALHFLTT